MNLFGKQRLLPQQINSLWLGDAIWRQRSRPTLAQVMWCYPTALSHNLSQYRLLIKEVIWNPTEPNFLTSNYTTVYNEFGNHTFEIIATSFRGNEFNSGYATLYISLSNALFAETHGWHQSYISYISAQYDEKALQISYISMCLEQCISN